jgi:hypothetical protein
MGLRGKMKTHKNLQKGIYLFKTNLVYHILCCFTRGFAEKLPRLAFGCISWYNAGK